MRRLTSALLMSAIFAGCLAGPAAASGARPTSQQPAGGAAPAEARGRRSQWRTTCDPSQTSTPDISGDYKGVLYTGKDREGEYGSLKIEGDGDFTLEVPSGTFRGVITAATTCGETSFALRFTEAPPGVTVPSQTFSLYGHKIGSPVGYGLENLESAAKSNAVVLGAKGESQVSFAFLSCPQTYPECYPVRERCPCPP